MLGSGSSLSEWFRESTLDRLLHEHRQGTADHGKRLWALAILAVWAGMVKSAR